MQTSGGSDSAELCSSAAGAPHKSRDNFIRATNSINLTKTVVVGDYFSLSAAVGTAGRRGSNGRVTGDVSVAAGGRGCAAPLPSQFMRKLTAHAAWRGASGTASVALRPAGAIGPLAAASTAAARAPSRYQRVGRRGALRAASAARLEQRVAAPFPRLLSAGEKRRGRRAPRQSRAGDQGRRGGEREQGVTESRGEESMERDTLGMRSTGG